jgi:hypothetical protein
MERTYKYRDILFNLSMFTQFTTNISTAGIILSNIINTHSTGIRNTKFNIVMSGIFIFSSGTSQLINQFDKQLNQQQINILKKYDMYNDEYIDQNIEIHDTDEKINNLKQNILYGNNETKQK